MWILTSHHYVYVNLTSKYSDDIIGHQGNQYQVQVVTTSRTSLACMALLRGIVGTISTLPAQLPSKFQATTGQAAPRITLDNVNSRAT